jgi:hypothetical protein
MAPGSSADPWKPGRKGLLRLLSTVLAFMMVAVARAEMIPTEQAVSPASQACSDSVLTFLRRSGVEHQLRSLGVGHESAKERVAALTDEEVRAVAGKLDTLIAAGQYVAPSVAGAGAAGSGYSGAGGGYGAAGGVMPILAIGLFAVIGWGSAQSNASDAYSMKPNPAPMDPGRKISEQDCTKPIVSDRGNLRCK